MRYLIFLVLLYSPVSSQNACNITVPIGLWLVNHAGPCDLVNGHFILDETANNHAKKLISTFQELRRIKGCLYVKGFTGFQNLSFFSKLEDVICDSEQAVAANLTNVIYVMGTSLKTMGFNSLKTVEGPGQIILSYEEKQTSYFMLYASLPEGAQCFSKKEMLFLARHPQFNGKMYQPCELDDPCFALDHYTRRVGTTTEGKNEIYSYYDISDIPENCSTFAGILCINGPYEYSHEVFGKFENLTLLIGQLHMMGTFLDRLDAIFPNLEYIYPYELTSYTLPSWNDTNKFTCNSPTVPDPTQIRSFATKRDEALQVVRVRMNRFLTNMSIPLRPIRPIDISTPEFLYMLPYEWFLGGAFYLPETIPNPCEDFPQFDSKDCGRYIYNGTSPFETDESTPDPYGLHVWIISIILTAVGVIFSFRAMALLVFSTLKTCLPHSRYFIVISILISMLAAVESCLNYQKLFDVSDRKRSLRQLFSEFNTLHLAAPIAKATMLILVSARYTCLVLLIFCHVDLAIFYKTKNLIVSRVLCLLVAVLAVVIFMYLQSQLYVEIRGRKPNYASEINYVIYMPFIMNIASAERFSLLIPPTSYLTCKGQTLYFKLGGTEIHPVVEVDISEICLELRGEIFPELTNISDGLLVVTTLLFNILARVIFKSHNNFTVLLLLYLHLSMIRIRAYIYDLLINDYCLRRELLNPVDTEAIIQNAYLKSFSCYTPYGHYRSNEIIMDEYLWRIVEKALEKLPYVSYFVLSLYCWKFARFQSYLEAALRTRAKREEKKNTISDDLPGFSENTLSATSIKSSKKGSRGPEEGRKQQSSNWSSNSSTFSKTRSG